MPAPKIELSYSAKDFKVLGFHDCFVHGFRWDISTYALILDLDYIVQWVQDNGGYKFWVAPAELHFMYASEVKISLDWTKLAMEAQIQDIHRCEQKATPTGRELFRWEIEFASPCGSIELWSTDFALRIQAEPRLLETQRLRGG